MEELKSILQQNTITEARQRLHSFVFSAEGYDDKLKLIVGLITLFEESSRLLQTIDASQFVSQLRLQVEELQRRSAQLRETYNTQLLQDQQALKILQGSLGADATDLQKRIEPLLTEYDQLVKQIVQAREKLPIEAQMKKEKPSK